MPGAISSAAGRSGASLGYRNVRCGRRAPAVGNRADIERRSPLSARRSSPRVVRPGRRSPTLGSVRGRPAPTCRPPRPCVHRQFPTVARRVVDGRELPAPPAAIVRRPAEPVPTPHRRDSTSPPSTPLGGFLRVLDEWMVPSEDVRDSGTATLPGSPVAVPATRPARTAAPEVRTWESATVLCGTHPSVSPSQMIAGARSAGNQHGIRGNPCARFRTGFLAFPLSERRFRSRRRVVPTGGQEISRRPLSVHRGSHRERRRGRGWAAQYQVLNPPTSMPPGSTQTCPCEHARCVHRRGADLRTDCWTSSQRIDAGPVDCSRRSRHHTVRSKCNDICKNIHQLC